MSLEPQTKDIVLNCLMHRCSIHIYSKPNVHTMFVMKLGDSKRCTFAKSHNYETKEHQYGQVLIITNYCLVCGFCQAEVIPSKEVVQN